MKEMKVRPNVLTYTSLFNAYCKLGKFDESVATLQRAFDLRPDPEIAAHLGEVMWANGKRSEAAQVWQTAIKDHPENEALNDVVKRFKP